MQSSCVPSSGSLRSWHHGFVHHRGNVCFRRLTRRSSGRRTAAAYLCVRAYEILAIASRRSGNSPHGWLRHGQAASPKQGFQRHLLLQLRVFVVHARRQGRILVSQRQHAAGRAACQRCKRSLGHSALCRTWHTQPSGPLLQPGRLQVRPYGQPSPQGQRQAHSGAVRLCSNYSFKADGCAAA